MAMVRKQFYISERQQGLLERLARARKVSEAEIVRQAIEHEALAAGSGTGPPDRSAWEEILALVAKRPQGSPEDAYHWNRDDAYDERSGITGRYPTMAPEHEP